jgi:hypothetical protein
MATNASQTSQSSRGAFPKRVARPVKRRSGKTSARLTPLHVRTRAARLDPALRRHLDGRAAREFGKFAGHIERMTVRFHDVNGPRGGVDQRCEMKIVLAGAPSVIVEKRGSTQRVAFDRTAAAAGQSLRRQLARAGMRSPRGLRPRRGAAGGARQPREDDGAATKVARSNFKRNTAGMTSALEETDQDRPSRKSTRGSANRALRDNNLRLRELRRHTTAKARAKRQASKKQR